MTMRLSLLLLFPGVAFGACFPVTGNRILGQDLALVDPQFAGLPRTLTIGIAPAPGTKRIYATAELERLARANGIRVDHPADICFEIPMFEATEEDAAAAMRRSLPADAELKVVELEKLPVPAGRLEFPIEALEPVNPATPGTQLWRGFVRYAETRKAPVWARVAVTVRFTVVVADKDIPLNTPIDPASLRVETRTGPLEREKSAARIEDVSGRILKRPLKAGSTIPLTLLADPPEVRRGDPVRVDVDSGRAHLELDAIAETSANAGDMVDLKNPVSGKTFRAKLGAGARAVIIVAPGEKL